MNGVSSRGFLAISKQSVLILVATLGLQSQAIAKVEAVLGISLQNNPNLVTQFPQSSESEIMISRDQYLISYNKIKHSPNWVAWKLESSQLGGSGRTNAFAEDMELENYLVNTDKQGYHAILPTDYQGSCFDRGHQSPSADHTDSIQNNQMTFMMSNMIPQTPYLNRVIWEQLEQHTRNVVRGQNKKAYIIAGPIYDQDYGAIGPHADIKVPSKNFKIIIFLDQDQSPSDINSSSEMITVIMPNDLADGTRPVDDKNALCASTTASTGGTSLNAWQKYQTTLSEVERLSGVHFFLN